MSRRGVRFRQALRRGFGRSFDRGVGLAWRAERWFKRATGQTHRGVQALAFTPSGELLLVELRYLGGWHLPGGGRRRGELPQAALLRELREELGPVSHGAINLIATVHEMSRGIRCEIALFRIDDCVLLQRDRLSAEVRRVKAWPLDSLPGNAAVARARLDLLQAGPGCAEDCLRPRQSGAAPAVLAEPS